MALCASRFWARIWLEEKAHVTGRPGVSCMNEALRTLRFHSKMIANSLYSFGKQFRRYNFWVSYYDVSWSSRAFFKHEIQFVQC